MKLKLVTLVESENVLEELFNLDLPAKIAFKLSVIDKVVQEKLFSFKKVKEKLIVKYGEESKEQQGFFSVKEENKPEYFKELSEILNEDIEIDCDKLSIDILEGQNIPVKKISKLSWLFE